MEKYPLKQAEAPQLSVSNTARSRIAMALVGLMGSSAMPACTVNFTVNYPEMPDISAGMPKGFRGIKQEEEKKGEGKKDEPPKKGAEPVGPTVTGTFDNFTARPDIVEKLDLLKPALKTREYEYKKALALRLASGEDRAKIEAMIHELDNDNTAAGFINKMQDTTLLGPILFLLAKNPARMPEIARELGVTLPERASGSNPVNLPTGSLSLEQARQYALTIVNRDRINQGLNPVVLDAIASQAGQRQANDMAMNGFTGHWGTDGSVPEQRYTEAGGEDFVMENSMCTGDGQRYQLDPNPVFSRAQIERSQTGFMNSPGHRKNILIPTHNRVGFGLAKQVGGIACMTQEFVDDHGSYERLPDSAAVGSQITVSGAINSPVTFGGIGVARIDPAAPLSYAELSQKHSYPIPSTYSMFYPSGSVTSTPVNVHGNRFNIDLPLNDQHRPGRYEISVWVTHPGESSMTMGSLRTITVR